jgi:polar amino acid transport system permease protein
MSPPRPQTIAGLRVVPRRHYGRWLSVLVLLGMALFLVDAFAHGQIDWKVVGQFMTAPVILQGMADTIAMTFYAMILGIVLGVIFAVMRMSSNPVASATARFYIWLFRGTPLLLQLLLWFNLALVFPRLGIPGLFEYRTVDIITPFAASLLGLGIGQGAYTAEVVRGGILSIDPGQAEAARAIGMTRLTTLRRIVLPQALRVIIPPVGNEIVSMIKLTSVASVIQYDEVLHNAQTIYYANARVIELLLVATVWYLALVTVFSIAQHFLEKILARSQGRRARPAAGATSQEA